MARKRTKKKSLVSVKALELAAGVEPVVEFKEDGERAFLMGAFNWYSAVSTPEDNHKWLLDYLKSKSYAHSVLDSIQNIAPWRTTTIGCYARMYSRGLSEDVGKSWFDEKMKGLLVAGQAYTPAPKAETDTPKISVQDRIKLKAQAIIGDIEATVDAFMENDYKEFKGADSFYEWLGLQGIKASYVPAILAYYTPQLDELKSIKTDPEVKEAYSNLTAKQVKALIGFYQEIVDDSTKLAKNAKKTRKTRKPRKKSVTVMVKKVKYLPEFLELQLQSIDPVKILAAQELWVYHTKKRIFAVYEAQDSGGLGIKGTTLTGVGKVRAKKLRKPADILKAFEDSKSKRASRKVFDGVKAKEKNLTTRLNGAIVLVRVF